MSLPQSILIAFYHYGNSNSQNRVKPETAEKETSCCHLNILSKIENQKTKCAQSPGYDGYFPSSEIVRKKSNKGVSKKCTEVSAAGIKVEIDLVIAEVVIKRVSNRFEAIGLVSHKFRPLIPRKRAHKIVASVSEKSEGSAVEGWIEI